MDYTKAIKELREKLLISQDELANLLDVYIQTVYRWQNRNMNQLLRLKENLKITILISLRNKPMDFFKNKTKLLGDDLRKELTPNSKVKIVESFFSIYAYESLKKNLSQ